MVARVLFTSWNAAAVGVAALSALSPPPTVHASSPPGADAVLLELWECVQVGRQGSIAAFVPDIRVCNLGTEELDWDGPPAEHHPFMTFNLYRLHGGRLQQIGQSWAKHALVATSGGGCGVGCDPPATNHTLGVGCSDVYNPNFNSNMQPFMGPRDEINPWTGAYTYAGSHISSSHGHGPIDHFMQVRDADLSAANYPGRVLFSELYIVAHDDVNHMNSVTWKQAFSVSGAPGGTWTFDLTEWDAVSGPAIYGWPGSTAVTVPASLTTDGRAILAYKVTNNGNGTWHYEYAIYNHDMDRAIDSFSLPRPSGATVTNQGFSAVESHEEDYSNDPWLSSKESAAISWSTESYESNPFSNPLRWGTMYNFWFDSSGPPGNVSATLGVFKPGSPASYTATVQGPTPVSVPGDVNGDGVVNVQDLLAVIAEWGPCPAPCPADVVPNGVVNVQDLLFVIQNWG